MDDSHDFFLPPRSAGLPDLPGPPAAIHWLRASGETCQLDPGTTQVTLREEQPEVDRLEADLGAICEVFKQSRYFYATISGVRLAAGDVLTLRYPDRSVILTVLEIEDGRARIDMPAVVMKAE